MGSDESGPSVEAVLRVTYEGPQPIPGYTITVLEASPWGAGSFLQVTSVQSDASDEKLVRN